jgi:hypothetical protein
MIAQIPLCWLAEFPITAAMTLYVPPARPRTPDPEMMGLFSMNLPYVGAAQAAPQEQRQ